MVRPSPRSAFREALAVQLESITRSAPGELIQSPRRHATRLAQSRGLTGVSGTFSWSCCVSVRCVYVCVCLCPCSVQSAGSPSPGLGGTKGPANFWATGGGDHTFRTTYFGTCSAGELDRHGTLALDSGWARDSHGCCCVRNAVNDPTVRFGAPAGAARSLPNTRLASFGPRYEPGGGGGGSLVSARELAFCTHLFHMRTQSHVCATVPSCRVQPWAAAT